MMNFSCILNISSKFPVAKVDKYGQNETQPFFHTPRTADSLRTTTQGLICSAFWKQKYNV